MRRSKHLTFTTAAAFALAMLFALSAFADSRHPYRTARDDRSGIIERYRENDRVQAEGRISSVDRERDGYRVRIDRSGYSFWVPERAIRSRGADFRVGISIRLGGIFRHGSIFVDVVDWPDRGYGRDYGDRRVERRLTGLVQRVDPYRGVIVIRDERTGRYINVDAGRIDDRPGRIDLNDIRRGDRIELTGDWTRDGNFRAWRIESLRKRW